MELSKFIEDTIRQITDGVLAGERYMRSVGGDPDEEVIEPGYIPVSFDVGVTSSEEGTDKIGGKVSVVQIFNAGGSIESSTKNSSTNRIQFKILITVPSQ